MDFKKSGVIIQGFDVVDVTRFIGRTSKKYQAVLLSKLEELYGIDVFKHPQMRKAVLDAFNDFTRDIVDSIFGDIEDA